MLRRERSSTQRKTSSEVQFEHRDRILPPQKMMDIRPASIQLDICIGSEQRTASMTRGTLRKVPTSSRREEVCIRLTALQCVLLRAYSRPPEVLYSRVFWCVCSMLGCLATKGSLCPPRVLRRAHCPIICHLATGLGANIDNKQRNWSWPTLTPLRPNSK